jgi:chaperone required for assembly of F1-ATPase
MTNHLMPAYARQNVTFSRVVLWARAAGIRFMHVLACMQSAQQATSRTRAE